MNSDEKLTNFDGMRLVLNPATLEFYLFADRDKAGLVYGQLDPNTTQVKYHVKRGDKSDGKVTCYIRLENMPFELTYYQPRPEKLLINNTTEVKVNTIKYERFNPEAYESGIERNPPKGLNSKAKKKWHREQTDYLKSKALKEEIKKAEEVKPVEAAITQQNPPDNKDTISNENIPIPAKEENTSNTTKVIVKENQIKKPIHGQGNKECLLKDYPDGYIIAYVDTKDNVIVILGTPTYPDSGLQRFLVFPSQKQASYAFGKLGESDFYKKQIVDGVRKFEVHSVNKINEGNRNVPALAIHDVYKFLQSPLMKIIKNG